jgi:hypothetical protein
LVTGSRSSLSVWPTAAHIYQSNILNAHFSSLEWSTQGCSQFKYNCSAVMRSSSKEDSYLRLIDVLYHSTLGRE